MEASESAARWRRARRITPESARNAARRSPEDSKTAISATTAAKDIWKLAPTRLSGAISSTAAAAQAMVRIDSACRSIRTASSTIATMTKARWAGGEAPDRCR